MRRPKGFGRNYFSLTAIQATVTAVIIHAVTTASQLLTFQRTALVASEEDPSDPPVLLAPLAITSEYDPRRIVRSCHCNCYYKRKTRNIFISLYLKYKPKYFCSYTVSGIAPPKPLLYSPQKLFL